MKWKTIILRKAVPAFISATIITWLFAITIHPDQLFITVSKAVPATFITAFTAGIVINVSSRFLTKGLTQYEGVLNFFFHTFAGVIVGAMFQTYYSMFLGFLGLILFLFFDYLILKKEMPLTQPLFISFYSIGLLALLLFLIGQMAGW